MGTESQLLHSWQVHDRILMRRRKRMERTEPKDLEEARLTMMALIARSTKAQAGFAPGTAHHTLQSNRIHALCVGLALIDRQMGAHEGVVACTKEALERARAPLASLASKSEKAREKLKPGSWQHRMLEKNLKALVIALPLLECALVSSS